jgi:hypothetical protein
MRQKQSKEIEMYGRIHSDICNVPKFLLPNIRLQIKFTKANPSFYLMNTAADSKTIFTFIYAKLIVKRVRPNPRIHLAHEETLKTSLSRYNVTRVKLENFLIFLRTPITLDRSGYRGACIETSPFCHGRQQRRSRHH